MKSTIALTTLALLTAMPASAGTMIDTLCGDNHSNEVLSADDVTANPDGYYIRSLQTQISHGDIRIVQAVGKEFHLCTRSAATPDMEATKAALLAGERSVKYLFVPTICPDSRPGS